MTPHIILHTSVDVPVIAPGVDIKSVTNNMLRYGFLLALPYRVRIGDLYRQAVTVGKKTLEVVLHNAVSIPPGSEISTLAERKPTGALWTRALIIHNQLQLNDKEIAALRITPPNQLSSLHISPKDADLQALQALNQFVVAYCRFDPEISYTTPPFLFTRKQFLDYASKRILFIIPEGQDVTNDHCTRPLKGLPLSDDINSQTLQTSNLHDLPLPEIKEAVSRNLRLQQRFVHYELAFQAAQKIHEGDQLNALLLGVAALEGAHAALVHHELAKRLPTEDDGLSKRYLAQLNMELCLSLTPYLFMANHERPSKEEILGAKRALTFRNDIMHARRNKPGKSGEYKMRITTEADVHKAYVSLRKVYTCYANALEVRLQGEGNV